MSKGRPTYRLQKALMGIVSRRRRIYGLVCHCAFQLSPNLLVNRKGNKTKHHRGVMAIKNIVISLEVEYLQHAAKERGISRTKLVQAVMEKVVRDERARPQHH
jgi:hypothetical protein